MPNLDNIRKAQERREARANKKAEHVQASEDQEKELAALSDRLRGVVPNEDGIEDAPEPKQTTKAKNVSRNATKRQRQEEAEKQAEADLQATVAPDDLDKEIDLAPYRAAGRPIPLHILNKLAARGDRGIKDEARAVAQAVGKLAYNELSGRAPERSRYTRNRRQAESITAMQKVRNAAKKDEAK